MTVVGECFLAGGRYSNCPVSAHPRPAFWAHPTESKALENADSR